MLVIYCDIRHQNEEMLRTVDFYPEDQSDKFDIVWSGDDFLDGRMVFNIGMTADITPQEWEENLRNISNNHPTIGIHSIYLKAYSCEVCRFDYNIGVEAEDQDTRIFFDRDWMVGSPRQTDYEFLREEFAEARSEEWLEEYLPEV